MKSIKHILILILILSTFTYAKDAKDIINDLKKEYDKVENLSAEFTQEFYWKLAEQGQTQEGSIMLQGSDKFRIETRDQIIVSDGKAIFTYSRMNNQVIIDAVTNNHEVVLPRELFMKFSKNYKPFMLEDEIINDTKCYVIRLTAKSADMYIKEMKVWVDKKSNLTKKIQHTDISENVTTYTLKNIQLNQKLSPTLFKFKTPEGAETVDLR